MRQKLLAVLAAGLAAAAFAAPAEGAPVANGRDIGAEFAAGLPRALDPSMVHAPRDRDGRVTAYVDGPDAAAAVAKAGGKVTAKAGSRLRATIPAAALTQVAAQPGVREVHQPERALPMSVTSEGVAQSNDNNWIAAGHTGAGVKVGIIDVGDGQLAAAQQAGELPANMTVNDSGCAQPTLSPHGTAVAEVVHDMAPDAQLFLACVDDSVAFKNAADWLTQQGVQVVNASIGFLDTGRGDGTGPDDSPAGVVRAGRLAGQLWVTAVGNEAQVHWAGTATSDSKGYVLFSSTAEDNGFALPAGQKATVSVRWDAWPTTNQDLDLFVMTQPHAPSSPTDPDIGWSSTRQQKDTPGGLSPTESVDISNDTGQVAQYWVFLANRNAAAGTHVDLSVFGSVTSLQYATPAGSVVEPASSPYALAVGATKPGSGVPEQFSGQGPTVDGRVKPDLTGYDDVSTYTYGPVGFPGTSAASAHVAGAAAVLKSANPNLDASEITGLLEDSAAQPGFDNVYGRGLLHLGPPEASDAAQPPHPTPYTPLATQTRILDTRTTTGNHQKKLAAGETLTLPIPDIPNDTTAVAVNVTAVNPSVATHLDLYGQVYGGTSDLNAAANHVNSVLSLVSLGSDRAIRIRNASGTTDVIVDLLGYFDTAGASTYTPEATPQLVLDSRGSLGGRNGKPLAAGEIMSVPMRGVAGVPSDATGVIVNVTGTGSSTDTHLDVFPQDYSGTSTVNLAKAENRSDLAVVGIGSDGAIRVRNASGTAHVLVSIVGWFEPGTSGSGFVALKVPARMLDTRTGTGFHLGKLTAGETMTMQFGGVTLLPHDATAVVANLVGITPNVNTFLTAWQAGQTYPASASSINVDGSQIVANAVAVPVDSTGQVSLHNQSGGIDVAGTIDGYFARS